MVTHRLPQHPGSWVQRGEVGLLLARAQESSPCGHPPVRLQALPPSLFSTLPPLELAGGCQDAELAPAAQALFGAVISCAEAPGALPGDPLGRNQTRNEPGSPISLLVTCISKPVHMSMHMYMEAHACVSPKLKD